MDPDGLPQTESSLANSPDDARDAPQRPEPSKLGIIHLLVWAVCVALYLGPSRMASEMVVAQFSVAIPPVTTFSAAVEALRAMGSGAALGGVVLLVSRRLRGRPFPTHPGEYLLVVLGVGEAVDLISMFAAIILTPRMVEEGFRAVWFMGAFLLLVPLAIQAAFWLWAIVRVKNRRWRAYLIAVVAAFVLQIPLGYLLWRTGIVQLIMVSAVLPAAVDLLLVVVVLKDRREGGRFPWTHWLGAAVKLWLTATSVGGLLIGFFAA